jgi:hypothetical protein
MAWMFTGLRQMFWFFFPNEEPIRPRQLPGPPGSLLLRLFITMPVTSENSVLPWRGSSRLVRIICLVAGWTIFFLLLLALVVDLTDLIKVGYDQSAYGKANRIITMISYCGSQFTLFVACTATFSLLMKRGDIIECAKILESLIKTLKMGEAQKKFISKTRPHLVRQKIYFFAVVLLGCIVTISPMYEPLFFDRFWDPYPYAFHYFPVGPISLYFRSYTLITILMNFPSKGLFAYFSSLLLCIGEVSLEENELFLHALKKKNSSVTHDLYVAHLRIMRDQNEKINSAFDQLQRTFDLKLLLDVMCNLGGLCIDVSWLSIWIIHPGLGIFTDPSWSLVRHVVILVLNLLCVWIVVGKPILLFFLVSFNQIWIK